MADGHSAGGAPFEDFGTFTPEQLSAAIHGDPASLQRAGEAFERVRAKLTDAHDRLREQAGKLQAALRGTSGDRFQTYCDALLHKNEQVTRALHDGRYQENLAEARADCDKARSDIAALLLNHQKATAISAIMLSASGAAPALKPVAGLAKGVTDASLDKARNRLRGMADTLQSTGSELVPVTHHASDRQSATGSQDRGLPEQDRSGRQQNGSGQHHHSGEQGGSGPHDQQAGGQHRSGQHPQQGNDHNTEQKRQQQEQRASNTRQEAQQKGQEAVSHITNSPGGASEGGGPEQAGARQAGPSKSGPSNSGPGRGGDPGQPAGHRGGQDRGAQAAAAQQASHAAQQAGQKATNTLGAGTALGGATAGNPPRNSTNHSKRSGTGDRTAPNAGSIPTSSTTDGSGPGGEQHRPQTRSSGPDSGAVAQRIGDQAGQELRSTQPNPGDGGQTTPGTGQNHAAAGATHEAATAAQQAGQNALAGLGHGQPLNQDTVHGAIDQVANQAHSAGEHKLDQLGGDPSGQAGSTLDGMAERARSAGQQELHQLAADGQVSPDDARRAVDSAVHAGRSAAEQAGSTPPPQAGGGLADFLNPGGAAGPSAPGGDAGASLAASGGATVPSPGGSLDGSTATAGLGADAVPPGPQPPVGPAPPGGGSGAPSTSAQATTSAQGGGGGGSPMVPPMGGMGGAAGGGGGGARERQTWLTNDDGTWDGGDVSGSNVLGKTTEQA